MTAAPTIYHCKCTENCDDAKACATRFLRVTDARRAKIIGMIEAAGLSQPAALDLADKIIAVIQANPEEWEPEA